MNSNGSFLLAVGVWAIFLPASTFAFEGRITAAVSRSAETQSWLYTVTTNALRVERGETDRPHAQNLLNLQTGELTLLFPHNRSFVRWKPQPDSRPPGWPGGLPPGIGPQTAPGAAAPVTLGPTTSIGPTNLPGAPAPPPMPPLPAPPAGLPPGIGPQTGTGVSPVTPGIGATPGLAGMPMMPMMPIPVEPLELKPTGQTTNLLGYPCAGYELKRRGETMEIWATDRLVPFQPWLAIQPHRRFGPGMLEEEWGELLRARKLFPLRAVLRMDAPSLPGNTNAVAPPGPERFRFEVQAVKQEKIADPDGKLFQPPADYHELRPLPF